MSIDITIGDLGVALSQYPHNVSDLERWLAAINVVLAERGLPQHDENRTHERPSRFSERTIPALCMRALRLSAARRFFGKAPRPAPDTFTDEDSDDLRDVGSESHLVHHPDNAGFYVPVDFEVPLEDERLVGGVLGSSQALLRELREVAPAIGIVLEEGRLPLAVRDDLSEEMEHAFHRERLAWHTLFECAEQSIAHRSVIMLG